MEENMSDNIKKIKNKDMAGIIGLMEGIMKVNGLMVKEMDMVKLLIHQVW
jgi:hypothetical protein